MSSYRKKYEQGDGKLPKNLRRRLTCAIRGNYRAGSAVRDLGMSISDFRVHFATKFEPGMTWENWGEWHIDHIRPLASFDLTDRAQLLQAVHHTNLQPLWADANRSKGAKSSI